MDNDEFNKTIERIHEFQKQIRESNQAFINLQKELSKSVKDHIATIESFHTMIDQYKELQKVCALQDKKITLLEQQILDMIKTEQEFVENNLYVNRIN
jgi:hypothetical protein